MTVRATRDEVPAWRRTRGPHRGHRTRFSEQVQAEVIELYVKRWMSLEDIVRHGAERPDWPRSKTGVQGILWAHDIRMRKRSWGLRNRHLPQAEVAETVRLYEQGYSVGQLASIYGRDTSTISERLTNAGVAKRHKSPSAHLIPQIRELRERGLSWAAIARELGYKTPDTGKRLLHGRTR